MTWSEALNAALFPAGHETAMTSQWGEAGLGLLSSHAETRVNTSSRLMLGLCCRLIFFFPRDHITRRHTKLSTLNCNYSYIFFSTIMINNKPIFNLILKHIYISGYLYISSTLNSPPPLFNEHRPPPAPHYTPRAIRLRRGLGKLFNI